jgi:hypothetical protein
MIKEKIALVKLKFLAAYFELLIEQYPLFLFRLVHNFKEVQLLIKDGEFPQVSPQEG